MKFIKINKYSTKQHTLLIILENFFKMIKQLIMNNSWDKIIKKSQNNKKLIQINL